jgi:quercetin dioxygenase-like cupin family protein
VESGTLTLYDERCDSQTYTAGEAVQMPVGHHHGHLVKNETNAPLVTAITFIVPAGAPLLIDHPAPHCGADL